MGGHCYVCYVGEDPDGLACKHGTDTDTVFESVLLMPSCASMLNRFDPH